MKAATITHRRLASATLMLLLGLVAILAPAAVADHGHKGGHGQKPEFLSCKPLVDFGSAVKQVADDTGITPDMDQYDLLSTASRQGQHIPRMVPTTECYLAMANNDMRKLNGLRQLLGLQPKGTWIIVCSNRGKRARVQEDHPPSRGGR